jgi:hypothetical protein
MKSSSFPPYRGTVLAGQNPSSIGRHLTALFLMVIPPTQKHLFLETRALQVWALKNIGNPEGGGQHVFGKV